MKLYSFLSVLLVLNVFNYALCINPSIEHDQKIYKPFTVIIFSAKSCPDCVELVGPMLEQFLLEQFQNQRSLINFVDLDIDIDENQTLANIYGIPDSPAFVVVQNRQNF